MPARKKKRRTLTPFQLRMSRWLRAIGIANVVFQWEHDHTAYLEELEALIEGNIYAPKIRDDLVKRLYAEKKRCGMTMTKLIHMSVENALKDREQEILPEVHDARKPRKPASHARQRVPKETHGHHPLRHVMSILPKTVFSPHRTPRERLGAQSCTRMLLRMAHPATVHLGRCSSLHEWSTDMTYGRYGRTQRTIPMLGIGIAGCGLSRLGSLQR